MDLAWLRQYCLSFPHATEQVLWGSDLVFKIGGKMFAAAPTEPAPVCLSFKCTVEEYAELVELPGIVPAPYSARYHWVALETEDALPRAQIKRLLRQSYELVFAGLPKKMRAELGV
ncbi:MAG TPA: MmcQ/YjbR family DNA-binding protein [Bryobacteraceae bacterium]|nr:MmcQ/YjbR family DNA-binding protein [Bryobacteraceae bacterium]